MLLTSRKMAGCGVWYMVSFIAFVEIACCFQSQVYVVYMGGKTSESQDEVLWRSTQLLSSVHGGSLKKARDSHVYTYSSGFRGFAAKLTEEQALAMTGMPDVVSVFPNSRRQLHTTHSWDFMGLAPEEAMEIPGFSTKNQENVIIGFIDTGIWPESPSFHEHQMPPVPARWKGQCQRGESHSNFTCNRKIIGARYYLSGYISENRMNEFSSGSNGAVNYKSPRDSSGHGSHTASIAAGRYVTNMNFNGLAAGSARGGAPFARIAVYKACWDSGCYDADILAAFDDAIRDGVDILSLSLGPDSPQRDYFNDAISIGSFHAISHGILVVGSAGNLGTEGSVTNLAPWILTVAAGSMDRDFTSPIVLGNRTVILGESLSTVRMNKSVSIISGSQANAGYFTSYQSSYCLESSLNSTKARGKILVCRQASSSSESKLVKSMVVKKAGGVGMILIDEYDGDVAIPFSIPAASVGKMAGDRILSYVNYSRNPRALILPARTTMGSRTAPMITAFSSKGPNSLNPDILKPDIAAPGLNILAAWSPATMKIKFNILSGTSMACPHVTGIAALIKAVHPSWSPSAIKSAILTTATILDRNGSTIKAEPDGRAANAFDYGSGFLNPLRVLDPGLVFDVSPSDYKDFLCSIGYDNKSLHLVTGDKSVCIHPVLPASNLNYPAISVTNVKSRFSVVRTVTNVGDPISVYQAVVSPPSGIKVTVTPKVLTFSNYGQRAKFTVRFRVVTPSKGYVFGSLSWKSNDRRVISPLVVKMSSFKDFL